MAALDLVVTCREMLISTQLFRFRKAVEDFYYALLFCSAPYANGAENPWQSWLKLGFNVAVRIAPPLARNEDQLTVDIAPGKTFSIKVSGSNRNALSNLRDLLGSVDAARKTIGGTNPQQRLQAIRANREIEQRLLSRMRNSLESNAISPEGIDSFIAMIDRGLLALTDQNITSVAVTLA